LEAAEVAGQSAGSRRPAAAARARRTTRAGFLGRSGGWTKLAGARFGPEIGWLYPLALLTLIAGLAWRGRARRTDELRAGLVMWGLWLVTFGVIFSEMGNIPHTAYMASLAPPLAALSGLGIVLFWRWYRSGSRAGWLLPAAVAAEVAWAVYLWSGYGSFLPWLLPAAIAAGAAAILVMVAARLSRRARAVAVGAGVVGVAAMLAAPTAWSASVLGARYAGSSFDASAGPAGGFGPGAGGGGGPRAGAFRPGELPAGGFRAGAPGGAAYGGSPGGGAAGTLGGGAYDRGASGRGEPGSGQQGFGGAGGPGGAGGGIFGSSTLSSGQQQLYRYVSAHRGGAGYLLAVQGWNEASAYILATGQEVLPMGGFSGSVPEPTLARVRQLVATGQLRFFLLGTAIGGPGGGRGASTAQVVSWVESACAVVPAQAYGASSGVTAGTLYQCGSR
jgi:4-amino-4-deoxy-L-arabinose transferase-like glycosyltransferase